MESSITITKWGQSRLIAKFLPHNITQDKFVGSLDIHVTQMLPINYESMQFIPLIFKAFLLYGTFQEDTEFRNHGSLGAHQNVSQSNQQIFDYHSR